MNKEQAADALNITVRTLQRHMAAHRIGFAMRRTVTGEEATFSEREVERFKAERDALTTTVTPALNVSESVRDEPSEALQRAGDGQGIAMVLSVLREAQNAPHAPCMLLSVKEAAEFSGLSSSRIMKEIHAGTLDGRKIGRGFKLRPVDVREFVRQVFNAAEKYRKPDKAERVKVGGRKVKGNAE
jgi:excisionase family DNA binding protein